MMYKEIVLKEDDAIYYIGYRSHEINLNISKHIVEIKYAGEPPHGDGYHEMFIDGKSIRGYVWGVKIAFPFQQNYIVCHWMSKLYERKTIIIDIERLKFIEMDKYWKVEDISDNQVTFTAYETYTDKNSKKLSLVASEDDFKEWLRE